MDSTLKPHSRARLSLLVYLARSIGLTMSVKTSPTPPARAAAKKKNPMCTSPVPNCFTFIPRKEVAKLKGMNTSATTVSLYNVRQPVMSMKWQIVLVYLFTESACCRPFFVSTIDCRLLICCNESLMCSLIDLFSCIKARYSR